MINVVSADMRQLALDMRLCSALPGLARLGLGWDHRSFDGTAGSVLPGFDFSRAGK